MSTRSELRFSNDRADAIAAVASVAAGRGWCNVVPVAVDDIPDLKINISGLWLNHGVPVATFVTEAPERGVARPSTLGVLHSRGRLGAERITSLINGAPFKVVQDHNQRGLLLEVPTETPAALVLDVMSTVTSTLCDYEVTGDWRMDLFTRS